MNNSNKTEHFACGKVYFDQGQIENAITEFKSALESDPNDPQILLILGRSYLQKSDYEKAVNVFERILTFAPNFADLRFYLGIAYLGLDVKEKALNELKEALNINPRYSLAKKILSTMMKFVSRSGEKSETSYSEIFKTAQDDDVSAKQANIHFHLGNALSQKGLLQEAIEEYKTALKLKPNYPDIRNKLGEIYMKKGLYNLAEEEFSLAIKINPQYITALINLGETHKMHSDYLLSQSEITYKKVLEIEPENKEIQTKLEKLLTIKSACSSK